MRTTPKAKKASSREHRLSLTKADELFLRKQSADCRKLYTQLAKRQRTLYRKAISELNKELDAQFKDALKATLKALKFGKDVKGRDEDPPWWRQKRIKRVNTH